MPFHHSGRTAGLLTIALLTFASVTMPARAQEPKHYRLLTTSPNPPATALSATCSPTS
jgi:hypothetical protein